MNSAFQKKKPDRRTVHNFWQYKEMQHIQQEVYFKTKQSNNREREC